MSKYSFSIVSEITDCISNDWKLHEVSTWQLVHLICSNKIRLKKSKTEQRRSRTTPWVLASQYLALKEALKGLWRANPGSASTKLMRSSPTFCRELRAPIRMVLHTLRSHRTVELRGLWPDRLYRTLLEGKKICVTTVWALLTIWQNYCRLPCSALPN